MIFNQVIYFILVIYSLLHRSGVVAVCYAGATLPIVQYDALISLYNATNGANWCVPYNPWNVSSSNVDDPCYSWFGVYCGCDQFELYVQGLILPSSCMVGTIPSTISAFGNISLIEFDINSLHGSIPSEIGTLFNLVDLTLSSNSLTGSIPNDITGLSLLQTLILEDNYLNGTIPTDIGALSSLTTFDVSNNIINGSIPESIYSIATLTDMELDSNQLTGTISPRIGDLKSVLYFYVDSNQLNGTLPSCFGNWTQALEVLFAYNNFHGSIPGELLNVSSIQLLYLNNNRFSGRIPPISNTSLSWNFISFNYNLLTGPIPSAIFEIPSLVSLYVEFNFLTGNLPSQFYEGSEIDGSVSPMIQIYTQNNYLTGSLPSALGSLPNLKIIDFEYNYFTGPIPSSLFALSALEDIFLSYNHLSSSISSAIGQMFLLDQIYVNENHLSGPFYEHFINSSHQDKLQIINIANNLFEGSISDAFSSFPSLSVLSSSNNCFDAYLPGSICNMNHSLAVLDLDGMGNNLACPYNQNLNRNKPFFVSGLFASVHKASSVPSCLFAMGNLLVLHLSGNNLIGFFSEISIDSSLEDLTVSHNELIGTIPSSIQYKTFTQLDLSNNRLAGTLVNHFELSESQSTLKLAVNRLSGPLPFSFVGLSDTSSYAALDSFDVLSSNIFQCQNSEIPSIDRYSSSYSCGSYDLDVAAVGWLVFASIGLIILLFIRYTSVSSILFDKICRCSTCMRQIQAKSVSWWSQSDECLFGPISDLTRPTLFMTLSLTQTRFRHMSSTDISSLTETERASFHAMALLWILRLIVLVAGFAGIIFIVICIPIYVGFHSFASIVSYDYGFVVSMAYLHGPAIVTFLAVFLSFSLGIISIGISMISNQFQSIFQSIPSMNNPSIPLKASESLPWRKYSILCLFHGLNLSVTLAVNAAYVSATLSDTFINRSTILLIQGCIGLFKLSWNGFYIPWTNRWLVSYTSLESCMFHRLGMSLINFIIAPVLATAIVNQSCFYYVFNAIPPIATTVDIDVCYTYLPCGDDDTVSTDDYCCTSYQTIQYESTIYPAFTYSYACGTALITSYTPVLIFSYIAYGVIVPLARYFLSYYHDSMNQFLMRYFPRNGLDVGDIMRVNGRAIVGTLCLHITVLLTFGLASPILGIIIAVAIIMDCAVSYLLIGKSLSLWRPQGSPALRSSGISPDCTCWCDGSCHLPCNCKCITTTNSSKDIESPLNLSFSDQERAMSDLHGSPKAFDRSSYRHCRCTCSCVRISRPVISPMTDSISFNPLESIGILSEKPSNHVKTGKLSRNTNNTVQREMDDMRDAWKGLSSCYLPVMVTISFFWGLLFFDMIADIYSVADGMAASIGLGIGLCVLSSVAYAASRKYSGIRRTSDESTGVNSSINKKNDAKPAEEGIGLQSIDIRSSDTAPKS